MKRAFTLAEILIVIIIIGILVSLSVPMYRKAVLRGHDREARAMLRLIQAAEKVYRLEIGYYIDCDNANDCNQILDLDLPTTPVWDYEVVNSTVNEFCAQAQGAEGERPNWSIIHSDTDALGMNCSDPRP